MTPEQLAIKNVGKLDPKRHLEEKVTGGGGREWDGTALEEARGGGLGWRRATEGEVG